MPIIIKDSNYWKEYNQKRREYLLLKKRESRAKLKELVVDFVVDTNNISVVDIKQVVDTNFKSVVDMMVVDRVQPVNKKVVDIQAFNEEVSRKARTKEETRFYTFSDGRKIVRTMCGCNPKDNFYDWCLDNCQYFTWWRNKQISNDQ